MKYMQSLFYCCLLAFLSANASASVAPHLLLGQIDCHPKNIQVEKQITILNVQKESQSPILYFIKNISTNNIWLNHPLDKDPSAKAGWGSYLLSNHWSALLLNQHDFAINCAQMGPSGKINYLDCAKTIKVCDSNIKLDPAISGSYWYVENQTWTDFLPKVKARLKK